MEKINACKPLDRVMRFGKYKGQMMSWVAQRDPRYLMWIGSLPMVRSRRDLWPSVRGFLLEILQAEQDADRFGDLA